MSRKILAIVLLLAATLASAQTPFRVMPEMQRGFPSNIRAVPTYIDARVLAANVSETHTIPTAATWVIFSANCAAFYAKSGGTAAVPAADVTDGTASELNPAAWFVSGQTQITLISPTACTVTLTFHSGSY